MHLESPRCKALTRNQAWWVDVLLLDPGQVQYRYIKNILDKGTVYNLALPILVDLSNQEIPQE